MNYYEFFKFAKFSGISHIRINPENELLRQHDITVMSAVNRAGQSQTAQWNPRVSVTASRTEAVQWVPVNAEVARSN